jgi:hypothetical protein
MLSLSDEDIGLSAAPPASLSDEDIGLAAPKDPYNGVGPSNFQQHMAAGMPIVGPLADKAIAAANAGLAPAVDYARGLMGKQPLTAPDSTFSQRYQQNLKDEQAAKAQYATEHPAKAVAGQMAGGAMVLGPAAEAAPAAFGVQQGQKLIPAMIRAGITNAGIGGANAVVAGGDPIAGAEHGAAFGAGGVVAGRILGAVGNKAMDMFHSASDVADEQVAQPLINRGLTTAADVAAHLNRIGPEATLLDADPVLTQKGGAIAATPGEGAQIIRGAVENRAEGAGQRIESDIDQTMGQPIDLNRASNQIYQNAKNKAGPLYQRAYQTPVQSTPAIDKALDTSIGRTAVAKAARLSNSDFNIPRSAMFGPRPQAVDATGTPQANLVNQLRAQNVSEADIAKVTGLPLVDGPRPVDVQGLHLIRQAYDDMINKTQGANNLKRVLNQHRDVIDQVLKTVREFKQADQIYSDQASIREAMENGLNVFKNSSSPEDIEAALQKMPRASQMGFLMGARGAVRNVMGTARNDAAAAKGMFAKEYNQEKLAHLIGQRNADTVLNRINAEKSYSSTQQRAVGNSETAARLEAKAALKDAHGLPPNIMEYSGLHGVARAIGMKALRGALGAIRTGRQDKIETNIAKLLTMKPGPDRDTAIQRIMTAAKKKDPAGGLGRVVTQLIEQYGDRKH